MSLSVFIIECFIMMAVFGFLVFGMLSINPLTFISDYPPEIQERYYASQHKVASRKRLTKIMAIKKLAAMIVFAFLFAWMAHLAGAETFWQGLLAIYGYILLLAAFDTFFLDWVLFANIKRIRLPGTENMDREYHQKWFHVKALFPVAPVFAIVGILMAALMVWIW